MARDRGRRPTTIYDNDATVIVETPSEDTNASTIHVDGSIRPRRVQERSVSIHVADLIDTLAGYTAKWFAEQKSDRPGSCYICKKETMCKIRKLCGDCMDKYSDLIYEKAHEAIENGESTITIDV